MQVHRRSTRSCKGQQERRHAGVEISKKRMRPRQWHAVYPNQAYQQQGATYHGPQHPCFSRTFCWRCSRGCHNKVEGVSDISDPDERQKSCTSLLLTAICCCWYSAKHQCMNATPESPMGAEWEQSDELDETGECWVVHKHSR